MFSAVRRVAVRIPAARGYSRTVLSQKGAGAAHDHHDDHEHHDHPMWEELPFKKSTVGPLVFGGLFFGVGLIWFGCVFQNKKHGFPMKKE